MSSYYAPCQTIALVLSEKEYCNLLESYIEKTTDETKEIAENLLNDTYEGDISEYKLNKHNPFTITPVITDECDGMTFTPLYVKNTPNAGPNFHTPTVWENRRTHNWYLISVEKQITPIHFLFKQTYTTPKEIYDELQNKTKDYLPNDFDWDKHIGLFEYCQYA